ncbi:hypothetical protein AMELA_G00128820 [Ameiurus melas]|uniref:Glutamate-rich protein 1 n=1 Tax=Ameiurus melas TaxID=219545 RepID=A0A7J6ANM7_AMEME|nr:hypothetical protein AMELA_G00128820 [Ameiurus melas]
MSLRKDVFQAKVLQRLYPAAREVEKVLETPVHQPQGVQLKPSKVTGHAGVPAVSGRKVYTVLPPPKDYVPARGDGLWSPTDAQPVNNADEMLADLSGSDEDDGRASKKRKRRRKRKAATGPGGNPPSADADKAEDPEERSKGNAEGSECLSKNKRRKMKKKRHKEKLLALGLVPRSTAVEFTYKECEEEEEDGDKGVEEVLDFLHSTQDLYLSDRKCVVMSIKESKILLDQS